MSPDSLTQSSPEQFRLPNEPIANAAEQLDNRAHTWDKPSVDTEQSAAAEQLARDAQNLAQATGEFTLPGYAPATPEVVTPEVVPQYANPEVDAVLDATHAAAIVTYSRNAAMEAARDNQERYRLAA